MNNFLKNLYPLTKFYLVLTLIISGFIIPYNIYGYLLFIICGIFAFLYGKLGSYVKRAFLSLFLLTLVIFLAQSLLFVSEEIFAKIWIFIIYKKGLFKAIAVTSKLWAIVTPITLLILITPVRDFITALEKKGINPKMAFILLLTLQMIPEMGKQAGVILDSQRSRGVETEGNIFVRAKALLPVFVPLVLSSILNTEERAITLEARGFSIGEKRTILHDIEETKNDKIMKIMLVIFIVLCIVWRVLWVISK